MSDFRVLNDLLDRISSDYQFNPRDEDYFGFLNMDPSADWTVEEYQVFKDYYENKPLMLEEALEIRGLEIETFGPNETVFVLSEKPFEDYDPSLYQGRTVEQAEATEKLVMASITLIIIAIIGFLAGNLF
jgi:hypothetical protein